jgi:hypothetical protein
MSCKHHIERLLTKVNEEGNEEPVTLMRMISDYITRLEKQADRYKKSLSLEAETKAD